MQNLRTLGFWFLAMTLCVFTPLYAQDTPLPVTDTPPAAEGPQRFSFAFTDTRLIQVLNILSELTGINFVAGKEISSRSVNMILDEASLEDVLEAIRRGTNVSYEFIPERKMYLFRASADEEALPALVTRVFKLKYILASPIREIESSEGGSGAGGSSSGSSNFANLGESASANQTATSIVLVVRNMLSERGKVEVDDRSNSLVVTDSADRIQMVEGVVEELDRKLDQVLIQVVLVETFEDVDRHLGIEWSSAATQGTFGVISGGAARTRFPFDLKWPGGKDIFGKDGITSDIGNSTISGATRGFGTQDFTDFTITIKALQAASKLKVLAKPRILVLDNYPALVKITTNSSIGQNSVATATGQLSSSSTTTTERAETGTSLRLTPHINSPEQITLTLEPRFVTLAASTVTDLADSTADPTIRTARTTLMVKNGQTIVMGGLLSSQQSRTDQKVPYLSEIPAVGEIFTKRARSIEDRELILFITPYIIRDPSEVEAASLLDDREHYEDATAPFWKFKQKPWYYETFDKAAPKHPEMWETSKRQQVMDRALEGFEQNAPEHG